MSNRRKTDDTGIWKIGHVECELERIARGQGNNTYSHKDKMFATALLTLLKRTERKPFERLQRDLRAALRLADDLLEDLELHGLHDSPEWNYRRQKAEFKRLDAALSTAEEKP